MKGDFQACGPKKGWPLIRVAFSSGVSLVVQASMSQQISTVGALNRHLKFSVTKNRVVDCARWLLAYILFFIKRMLQHFL